MFKVHHLALSVENIDASMAFYAAFGFEKVLDWNSGDGTMRLVHLQLGEFGLELFCYFGAVNKQKLTMFQMEFIGDLSQVGMKHLSFVVDDIEAAYKTLNDQVPLATPIRDAFLGDRIFVARDPDGNFIEVVSKS